jgi:hypothetical protein
MSGAPDLDRPLQILLERAGRAVPSGAIGSWVSAGNGVGNSPGYCGRRAVDLWTPALKRAR